MIRAFITALAVCSYASAVPLPETCGVSTIKPNLSARIVGGKEAIPNSWPWQIQVRVNNNHYCGASILSNDWILCAAHCVYGKSASGYSIRAGRHTRSGMDKNEQVSPAKQLIWHEKFNMNNVANDVSLIRVSTPFKFNSYVSPVCLADTAPQGDTKAWLTGWGKVQGTGSDGKLKQAMLPIIDRATCSSTKWWGKKITDGMVCAGYADASQGGCSGDSGGPLVVQDAKGVFKQVGIVSWGARSCTEAYKPTVFADVNYYTAWIKSRIVAVEQEEQEVMAINARGFNPRLGAAFRAFANSLEN